MNSLNFTGNCGKDAELRYTQNGEAILGFSVALSSGYGDKKITTWINCSLFGKRAEAMEPFIKKGTLVGISGEFAARPYTSKDGETKLSLEMRVSNLTLLGAKKDNQNGDDNKSFAPATAKQAGYKIDPADPMAGFEDDIPF
jgi:single-strand DNA-binding protein